MTEKELLQNAAAYIQKHGWIKEDFGRANGPVCLLGALRCAAGFDPEDSIEDLEDGELFTYTPQQIETYLKVVDRIEAAIGRKITVWNDLASVTLYQVLKLLREMTE